LNVERFRDRAVAWHTTASTPSGGMPGRAGLAPGGRTATRTEIEAVAIVIPEKRVRAVASAAARQA
jgi:hypothetical protein